MNKWESFASSDPYFYIDTDFDHLRNQPDAIERFYESGRKVSAAMLDEVGPLFRGRSLAIEIGCGVGRVLLGHARNFERVRGVDVAPRMLSLLEERVAQVGIENVRSFLPTQPWDEPTGSADYVYSLLVFQHIEDPLEIATYIQSIGSVLRRGAIAQLQFDTRPESLLYRSGDTSPTNCSVAPSAREFGASGGIPSGSGTASAKRISRSLTSGRPDRQTVGCAPAPVGPQ